MLQPRFILHALVMKSSMIWSASILCVIRLWFSVYRLTECFIVAESRFYQCFLPLLAVTALRQFSRQNISSVSFTEMFRSCYRTDNFLLPQHRDHFSRLHDRVKCMFRWFCEVYSCRCYIFNKQQKNSKNATNIYTPIWFTC